MTIVNIMLLIPIILKQRLSLISENKLNFPISNKNSFWGQLQNFKKWEIRTRITYLNTHDCYTHDRYTHDLPKIGLDEVVLLFYKNQRAYLAIPIGDIKGLMILKNVLSCFKQSYRSVQISK